MYVKLNMPSKNDSNVILFLNSKQNIQYNINFFYCFELDYIIFRIKKNTIKTYSNYTKI